MDRCSWTDALERPKRQHGRGRSPQSLATSLCLAIVFWTAVLPAALPARAKSKAEDDRVRTLETRLASVAGAERLGLLNDLAEALDNVDPARQIATAREALALARQRADRREEARALFAMGSGQINRNEVSEAAASFEAAGRLYADLGDTAKRFDCIKNVGWAHESAGRYDEALAAYERALAFARGAGFARGEAVALGLTGTILISKDDYAGALERFLRARSLHEARGDERQVTLTESYIGTAFSALGEHGKALPHYERALAGLRKAGDEANAAIVLSEIGLVHTHTKRLKDALAAFEEALQISTRIDDRMNVGRVLGNMAGTYVDLGELERARETYTREIAIWRAVGNETLVAGSLSNLAELDLKQNDCAGLIAYTYQNGLMLAHCDSAGCTRAKLLPLDMGGLAGSRSVTTGSDGVPLIAYFTYEGFYEPRFKVTYLDPWPLPTKGDFEGDGQVDLVFRNATTDRSMVWLMNGATRKAAAWITPDPPSPAWRTAAVDDFDSAAAPGSGSDGQSDLVLHNATTGEVQFWLMNGTSRVGPAVALSGGSAMPAPWQLAASGDFNDDGRPDLLWRNGSTQKLLIWTLNGTVKVGSIVPTPDQAVDANWVVAAALDLNGDLARDLVWYNVSSGKIVHWWMNASVVRIAGLFNTPASAGHSNWSVQAGGDLGLGTGGVRCTKDLVWRNATSGKNVVWWEDFAATRTAGGFTVPDAALTDPDGNPTAATDWLLVGPK